jgi:nucleoside-diphosphate-sugar epimerase
MKVLVTGGAGFIGSHLVEALVNRGDEVWALDDLSTGSVENLENLQDEPRFHFVEGSVMDAALVQKVTDRVDFVYHLAAAVGVKFVLENPLRSLLTNIRGSENVLESAYRAGNKPVVLFSSSEVYGKGTQVPFTEDQDRLLGPTQVLRWSYATSKSVDEYLAMGYHQERQLPVVVVRCFNTTGPRQSGSYGMVLPRFIQQAMRGESLLVYGDGSQTRCFSYVGDVVRGTLMLADEPRAFGGVFNIGTEEEVSVLTLAQRVKEVSGSASPIEFVAFEKIYGERFEDMQRRVPSLKKINDLVGYKPQCTLEELLHTTIAFYREKGRTPYRATSAIPTLAGGA